MGNLYPAWTALHAKIHHLLKQKQLLKSYQGLLLAVSGGQDSLCLSKLFLDLQSKWHWQIAIAHCDHRWSSDAGMAAHVEKLAQQWQIPFYLKTAPQIKETEAAAREWRYQALLEIAQEQGLEVVLTGHTQSDRAETLLYNLIRGAGTDGLQALSWQRPLTENIQLVRPLLTVSRNTTWQFCQDFHLPIWEDALNQNFQYARNRIRGDLIPYLQTHFNPNVENSLAQTAEIFRAEVEYLETIAQNYLQQVFRDDHQALNRDLLRHFPLAIQRRVIRQFLKQKLSSSPTFSQIEALVELIDAPNLSRTSSFPGNTFVQVEHSWIIFISPE